MAFSYFAMKIQAPPTGTVSLVGFLVTTGGVGSSVGSGVGSGEEDGEGFPDGALPGDSMGSSGKAGVDDGVTFGVEAETGVGADDGSGEGV